MSRPETIRTTDPDPDYSGFAVKVPRGGEDSFRELFRILFEGEGEIVFDQQQELLQRERFEAALDEKIADFLAPKDLETEEKIGRNLRRLFSAVFEDGIMKITAFHLGTPEEIRRAKEIFHTICSAQEYVGRRHIDKRAEVNLIERFGLINGEGKTQEEVGLLIGVGLSQVGHIKRHALIRLGNGRHRKALQEVYANLVPAVLELEEVKPKPSSYFDPPCSDLPF